ncbi:MAG TPA: porin [Woeseiaceae bacterium]|nr:porin [Woeseiaceae bacterium]
MVRPLALVLLGVGGGAAAEVDVYGRLNVTLQDAEEAGQSVVELQSNASRVGVKGEEELGKGLSAIYQFEWEVDPDGQSGDDNFSARNQFVGLTGAFGTVKVGRHDTALKEAQGDFDLFNDLEGDINDTFLGENRLENYLGYTTPEFADAFSVTVNVFPGEDPASGNDGAADGTSVSLNYETDIVYAAVAHDTDLDGEGIDSTRLAGGYTLGAAQFGLLYQRTDAGTVDGDGFGASVAYAFGDSTAKLQYLDADIWRVDPQVDPLDNLLESQVSVGLDHRLGENTKVFGFYTAGDIGGTNESNDYLAIGIEHRF